MEILEKVRELIAEQLGVDIERVSDASNLIDDLKADSLDVVELIMDLEQEFGIRIDDEDLPKVVTVGSIVEYIKSKK